MARGEPRGLQPSWHLPGSPLGPNLLSSSFAGTFGKFGGQASPLWGHAISKGCLYPGAGLAISAASSSTELTSKFTSNPLLFPGSSPISQLSTSELAAQHAAKADEERTVPPQGFSQALLPHSWPEGLPVGSVSPLPSLGNAFAFCCHVCPCPRPRTRPWQAGAGNSPPLCLQALPSLQDAMKPISHPDTAASASALKSPQ